MPNLQDIIAAGEATFQEHQSAINERIAKRNQLLIAIRALIVAAVAAELPAELQQYLSFAGDPASHLYTDQPIALVLAIPDLAPIDVVVNASVGVDVTVKVGGVVYPSLGTAIGAAKAAAAAAQVAPQEEVQP